MAEGTVKPVGNLPLANVGKVELASEKMPSKIIGNSPSANVGKNRSNVLSMPTLAKAAKPFNWNELKWQKSAGKPPFPSGFYWQASGSKSEKIGSRNKLVAVGWTLIRNSKCQSCETRYRPPVAYLNGKAWATLQKEDYERQKIEIKLLLGNAGQRLNDLRCPECVSGANGKKRNIGIAS